MRTAILAFVGGILWLQMQAELPAFLWAAAAGAFLVAVGDHKRPCMLVMTGAFLLGIGWAGWMAQQRLADALPRESEGRDIELVGVIASLPQRFERGVRFDLDVERSSLPVPGHVALAWYAQGFADEEAGAAPAFHAGERWRLTVRLKRPHGNLNPHGFDYEAWLFERGIRATGYVRPKTESERLSEFVAQPGYLVERARERVKENFAALLPDAPYAGILLALSIGDQRAIDATQWEQFRKTGITHLMSISGLHVTMLAGLIYWLVGWGWRRSPRLMLRLPAQQAAALGGFLAAFAYCLLSGFAVPAQRTLYMLAVVAAALWARRQTSASRVLLLALLLVLLLDPWAVLAAGFWLSFGAVALLFYAGSGRLAEDHPIRAWGRAQWAVTLGMIPALLALFQQFSLASPIANAVAIPVVSFVITPLALLAAVLPLPPLLWLAHAITAVLMAGVEWLAAQPWAIWQQHAPPDWAVALGLAGVVWLLLPRGFPARWLGIVLLLPLVLVPPPRPAAGELRMTLLDVGQGLAMHLATAHHDLLFDTGPAFSEEANSGNRIIVPYLHAVGAHRLDGLVVTHEDTDHSGGAQSVIDALPVDRLMTSLPYEHPLSAAPVLHIPCADGQSWEWDGVRFEMLHPPAGQYDAPPRKTNDMSCVLRVVTAHGRALLTSDIEAPSESALVARHRNELAAEVLVVPHHGSRTSSTTEFVAAVGAREALFPVGYLNRYGHPKADVVERYRGAQQWRSDRDGALTVSFAAGGVSIAAERAERRRYWHGS